MATTRSNKAAKPDTISREEFEATIAKFQSQNKTAQNPLFKAWSSFFYSIFNNPRTTLAGIGASLPFLHQAYEQQNWPLAIAGLSSLMTGAMAGDARKPQPPVDETEG